MREISKGLDQLAENPDPGITQKGRRAFAFPNQGLTRVRKRPKILKLEVSN